MRKRTIQKYALFFGEHMVDSEGLPVTLTSFLDGLHPDVMHNGPDKARRAARQIGRNRPDKLRPKVRRVYFDILITEEIKY